MGVIKRGILGGFSGKVANVVGSSWKGIAVIKSLPLSVANPNTAAQQATRGRFAQAVAFAGVLLVATIKPLWDRFAQQESGYNAFIGQNIAAFDDAGLATPADLMISKGTLTGVDTLTLACDASADTAIVGWVDNTGEGNASASDEIFIVIYNQTTKAIIAQSTGTNRVPGSVTITADGMNTGNTVRAYAAFRTETGFLVSDTATVTAVVVA